MKYVKVECHKVGMERLAMKSLGMKSAINKQVQNTVENTGTPNLSDEQVLNTLKNQYSIGEISNGTLKPLDSYRDQNFLFSYSDNQYPDNQHENKQRKDSQRFVIKISNTAESKLELEMQNAAMLHLAQHGLPVPQVIASHDNELITTISDNNQQTFHLRVLSFVEGVFYSELDENQHQETLWSNLGLFIGKLQHAFSNFQHQGAYRYLDWDLSHGYAICHAKKQHLNRAQSELVKHFLTLYQIQTLPRLSELPRSIIHNDLNDHNVLLDEQLRLSGLIDFGDMVHSQTINELAIACAYALMGQEHPIVALKSIVASYHQVSPISELEIELLPSLIALRLCTSVCNSAEAIKQEPNNEYLMVSAKPAWQLLHQLKDINNFSLVCQLKLACGLPVDSGRNSEEITDFRKKHLGKSMSLSYQQPIKMVRGQGAYLYDQNGSAYLDMVNNVCHVGHCHPKVVAAGQKQMAKLNTNTRYLHDNIVDFSEALLATLPKELSVCMFVNSGSEANELAFRLARNATGSKELLTVEGAYHGSTNACIEASPYKFNGPGGTGPQDYVHIVELPDPYRGKHQGNTLATAHAYADSVGEHIDKIESSGKKVGAFICESLQGVAGQIIMPDGYLSAVYEKVRKAGGVCIADEVQVGFGRVGSHMWAFETQNVVPDIVTLGKPIGNGHPLAAVITTQEIAEKFVTGMEFFNTFGGNPVSCAIGSAVLDVIKKESLQKHAKDVGDFMLEKLTELQQQFDLIGDVRGLGLFLGVELVENRETKEPAGQKAKEIVEFCKQHKILLSTEGKFYNIIKIKPPMVFSKKDAEQFISIFTKAIRQY